MAEVLTGTTLASDGGDLEQLHRGFRAACTRQPRAVWRAAHDFGGWPVHVSVIGAELARLVESSFAHLAVPAHGATLPALRIDAWDERATGVAAGLRLNGVRIASGGRFIGYGCDAWIGVYDRLECHLVVAVRAPARLSYVDRARPFSRLLLIWYADRGCLILHAGLVAEDGRGVLIAGAGRSGKSTTVLACARSGFTVLGDDCVALRPEADGRFTGFSVYRALLVDPRAVRLFDTPATANADDSRGRETVLIEACGDDRTRRAAVTAMVLQHVISAPDSRLAPIGRGAALRTLLPTALAMDSLGMGTRRGFEALTALLDGVPCHRLDAGSDWRAIPAAVRMAL